jgi:penicillin-binding protein 1B
VEGYMPKKVAKKKSPRKQNTNARRKRNNDKPGLSGRIKHVFSRIMTLRWLFASLIIFFVIYLATLDAQILKRFEGRIWQLPAKVYARPLELYAGKALSLAQIKYELELLGYEQQQQLPTKPGSYYQWQSTLDVMTRGYSFWDGEESPQQVRIRLAGNKIDSLRYINTNEDVAVLRFEPAYIAGIFPQHGEDRFLLDIEDVPDAFLKMLILTEDRRFFDHIGIDFYAIARAFIANLKAGRTVQGGSTLTQQLVKNLYLSSERSLIRKINEALMAMLLEFHYDKRTILQTYLNEIYLGQDRDRAIHGFGLASQYYFSLPLKQLDYDQIALLVGMVKGASYYNPVRQQQRAKERRNVVLKSMLLENLISPAQYTNRVRKDIQVRRHSKRTRYPAFMNLVTRQLKQYYDEDDLQAEGLNIYTTLDPYIQQMAEQAVAETVETLFRNKQDIQLASVIAAHGSGDVLAVIGDADPKYPGFNRALDASRQIGSLIKPVVYLTALSEPDRYTLATVIDDAEIELINELGVSWKPQNYDREFIGDVLLFDALLKSRNVPAVKTGIDIGLGAISKTFSALGARSALRLLPSMTLGAIEMTPFEMTSIYQTFAADGFHSPLQSVYAVTDKHGKELSRSEIEVERNVQQAPLSLVNYTLSEITRQGTARRLSGELDFSVAGKTGTSDDLRDSWFAGFSGELVSVVWMGYDDNSPTGLTGSSGAMRVWSRQMQKIIHQDYQPRFTGAIEFHLIDHESGLLGGAGCENTIQLPFIAGSQPKEYAECADQESGGWFDELFGN